jgi:muconate cycloisomerase
MNVEAVQLDIYRTKIPMRRFEHAAASRDVSDGVVVRMKFSDGRIGWGETFPRQYVTGETVEGVVEDLSEILWPLCAGRALGGANDLDEVPIRDAAGRCISAAACAMDLGSLRRLFPGDGGAPSQGLLEMAGRSGPRKQIDALVSGVLGSTDPARTARGLRRMRWFGIRDFKLKLGLGEDIDAENLRIVRKQLGRGLARGRCTFRVDVNGGWDAESTPDRVEELSKLGVCVVEQPVYCSPVELLELARKCSLPLMADESLRTEDDARFLLQAPTEIWWNIRLSKNGGFVRSLFLARLAAEHRIPFTLGCMVGESSILSWAQRLLLQWSPIPRFIEGNYGRFLLADDLVRKPLRFGYGGKLKPLKGAATNIHVDLRKLNRYGKRLASLGKPS